MWLACSSIRPFMRAACSFMLCVRPCCLAVQVRKCKCTGYAIFVDVQLLENARAADKGGDPAAERSGVQAAQEVAGEQDRLLQNGRAAAAEGAAPGTVGPAGSDAASPYRGPPGSVEAQQAAAFARGRAEYRWLVPPAGSVINMLRWGGWGGGGGQGALSGGWGQGGARRARVGRSSMSQRFVALVLLVLCLPRANGCKTACCRQQGRARG